MSLLATMEDFAAARGVAFDPTDLGAMIALEGASSVIRTYTGQSFDLLETDAVTLDGTGTASLLLPELPALDVTEVTTTYLGTVTTLEVTDYDLGTAGILWRTEGNIWPLGHVNIAVTYDHGYAMPPERDEANGPLLPADLQMVTMQLASRFYEKAQSGGQVLNSETIGSYSRSFESGRGAIGASVMDLTWVEQRTLDAYRGVSVA